MIEKLPQNIILPRDANGHKTPVFFMWDKINELVDAVNSLRDDCNLLMGYIAPENKCEPTENKKCAENAQDPYAEGLKWVGKLCRFRHCDDTRWKYGILKDVIYDTSSFLVDIRYKMGGIEFRECEPVKPDDDIIYKGGKDE